MFGRGRKHREPSDPRALEAAGDADGLASLLSKAVDPTVRAMAAAALGRVGGMRATLALQAALKDPDRDVRIEAVDALGVLGGPRAAGTLLEALETLEPETRGVALQQLVRLKEPRVLPRLVEMARDPRSPVRRAAVTALGGFRDRAAVDALIDAARDQDPVLSDLAVRGLGRVGGSRAVPVLTRLRSPAAARALGRIGDASAVDGLIQLLGSVRDDLLRSAAADGLAELGRADPSLHLEALAATRGDVSLLAECGDPRASAALARWLFAADPGDRIAAARGLGRLGDSSLVPMLEQALQDPVPEVCRAAADAIAALCPDLDRDPLIDTVLSHMTQIQDADETADPNDMIASVDFLGRLRATLALPALHGLESHPHLGVREATRRALQAITGR